jgi:pilus assembly protein Flp/PilA
MRGNQRGPLLKTVHLECIAATLHAASEGAMKPTSESIQRAARGTRGQGMTEYILIVFLVAVAVIGAVGLFGDRLRNLFGIAADATAGETSAANNGGTSGYGDSPGTAPSPGGKP